MFRFCLSFCIFIVLIGCQPAEKPPEPPGDGGQKPFAPQHVPGPDQSINKEPPFVPPHVPPPDQSILDDYLDEEKSKQWLQDNGYQLLKDTDGKLFLQRQHQSPGVDWKEKIQLGGTMIGYRLAKGATMLFYNGEIRIKIKED